MFQGSIIRVVPTLFLLLFLVRQAPAQKLWHLHAPVLNKSFGIDAYGAAKLLEGKKATPVIVAVIDNGTQTSHPYLRGNIWVNKGEIPGNNKDDDGNGYVDDINGWNFLGGAGGDISYAALETTREYFALQRRFADTTTLTLAERHLLDSVTKVYRREQKERQAAVKTADWVYRHRNGLLLKPLLRWALGASAEKDIKMFKEDADSMLLYNNFDADSLRKRIVGDRPDSAYEQYYGNNHVDAANPTHGTHTAGIVTGVCRAVDSGKWLHVMTLRAVPVNGDEHDKDVASAIRYAVDNGAKIINMSFGKYASMHKEAVRLAVRYAMEHDVLLVHAAGNDAKELADSNMVNYPNPFIDSGTTADNFIQVGATSANHKRLIAPFSNYGRFAVDILAPGVNIYSSIPVDTFAKESGTSMAAPVVAGVAAIIRSYYPHLTAPQVKELMMQTVTPHTLYTPVPGRHKVDAQLWFFSRSAGIINAAGAVGAAGKK